MQNSKEVKCRKNIMFLRHFTSFEFCIAYFANKTILTAKIFFSMP